MNLSSENNQSNKFFFCKPDQLHNPVYVVTPVINSGRFRTRWRLYQNFEKMIEEAGGILYTVEVAFGSRDFAVTQPNNPRHLQLRTHQELWLKERAINLMVSRLPVDWKKVLWIDADCEFARPDFISQASHLLEHYPVIQLWSEMHDLSPEYETMGTFRSFMSVQLDGNKPCGYNKKKYQFGSPGLAWGARREAWNQFGGLIDHTILGAGDWYFAHAMMGTMKAALCRNPPPKQVKKLFEYQDRIIEGRWEERPLVGNVGLMRGSTFHYWHGPRVNRGYSTRGNILIKHDFDPDLDLKPDWQGLYQLTNRKPEMRREIQQYFQERQEDKS